MDIPINQNPKSNMLLIRLKPEDRENIDFLAEHTRRSRSEVARYLINKTAKDVKARLSYENRT